MDINLPQQKPYRRYLLIAAGISLVSLLFFQLLRPAVPAISLADYPLTSVQQGELTLYSDALGELIARQQRLLTAPAAGIITEILHRPGSEVAADTVVIRLENPELDLKVIAAANDLQKMQAELTAFDSQQINQLLEQQGRLAELENQLQQAELELKVNQELTANGIAARIELQRAELRVTQQRQKLEFEQKKYAQFARMQQAEKAQKTLQLSQLDGEYQLLLQQQTKMQLTAGISGYLQQLDVELGQSVASGQALARVGSQHELSARIQLNQRHAEQIFIGSPVFIETRGGMIEGQISRIEAVIQNGSIAAEVSLPDQLPAGSRPAQQITAKVLLQHKADALYIRQSPGLRPNSSQILFVKTSANTAEPREVHFGELSDRQLLIEAGLEANEQILAYDKPDWQLHSYLILQ